MAQAQAMSPEQREKMIMESYLPHVHNFVEVGVLMPTPGQQWHVGAGGL